MVCPGPVVHTLGQLHKQNEVLRPQIERPIRSAKVKALAFAEFPFSIFASMTLSVPAWLDRRDELPLPGPPVPEQGLAAFGYLLKPRGRGVANFLQKDSIVWSALLPSAMTYWISCIASGETCSGSTVIKTYAVNSRGNISGAPAQAGGKR